MASSLFSTCADKTCFEEILSFQDIFTILQRKTSIWTYIYRDTFCLLLASIVDRVDIFK